MGLIHVENPRVADRRSERHNARDSSARRRYRCRSACRRRTQLRRPTLAGTLAKTVGAASLNATRKNCAAILRERTSTGTRKLPRAGSQCWPSAVIPPPVISRWTHEDDSPTDHSRCGVPPACRGAAPRCRLSAQRSMTALAETCISRPYINFWSQRNAVRNSEGTVTTA